MSRKTTLRLLLLVSVTLMLMYLGRHPNFSQYFSLSFLEQTIQNTGLFGIVLFGVVYVVGTLMNIPGMIFLFVLFLVYDGLLGLGIGYVSTLASMIAHLYFTRAIAGNMISEVKHPTIKKYANRLLEKPLQTVIILRLLLFISPPVNYALALSPVRVKHVVLGSMIAMPVNLILNYLLTIYAKDFMMNWLG